MAKRAAHRSARRHSSTAAAGKRPVARARPQPSLGERLVAVFRGAPGGASPGGTDRTAPIWSRAVKVVLAAGALATAVTAIVSLLPSHTPDPENSARFAAVRVTPEVPLSEYRQRNDGMVPAGGGEEGGPRLPPAPTTVVEVELAVAAAHGRAAPGGQPATTVPPAPGERSPSTTRPAPSTTRSTATAPSGRTAPPTTRPPASTGPPTTPPDASSPTDPTPAGGVGGFVIAPATAEAEAAAASRESPPPAVSSESQAATIARARVATGCESDGSCSGVDPMSLANSISLDGTPIPPDEAAARVVALLDSARRTGDDPLGIVVATDLEMVGLRGETIFLSWSMWQEGGQVRLHGDWLNENLAYRLQPTTDRDTTTLDLWVPLPREPGAYFVRVELALGDSSLASADSELFA
jgi:hypothetical protein